MNEQIIVTQGDSGIKVSLKIIDIKKQIVNLTDCDIDITIVKPSGDKKYPVGIISSAPLGECYFILTGEHTDEEGLCTCYVQVVDDVNNIHTQDNINYYVLPYNGGVN